MKILIVGNGGREHALAWAVARSPLVSRVFATRPNAGMAEICQAVDLSPEDVDGLAAWVEEQDIDLTVVGPEAPLAAGLADRLRSAGRRVVGPARAAARLEASKVFSKRFLLTHGIPTAAARIWDDAAQARTDLESASFPLVLKADGLAAGKGVIVCRSPYEARQAVREMLGKRRYGAAGTRLVIEDLLDGEEASVLAICDGRRHLPLVAAQDHKAAYEGDTGPNTGGMGAYAPAPVVTERIMARIEEDVLARTVAGMAADGTPFRGVLYAGLMIQGDDLKVLEFNVRFGDPECQPLMALMKSDLVPVLAAAAGGDLGDMRLEWHHGAALCVVLAAGGYPGPYEKGKTIEGLADAEAVDGAMVFHAGTRASEDGYATNGGRVLGVTARGDTLKHAAAVAYEAAGRITWEGMRMRRDIGHRAL